MTFRELIVKVGYSVDETSAKKVDASFNQIKQTATKVLGAIGIGLSLVNINKALETFKQVNDTVRQAAAGMGDMGDIQRSILRTANETRRSYEDTAAVMSGLIMQNRQIFSDTGKALKFVELTSQAWKSVGRTEAQIASLNSVVNRIFALGIVDGENFQQLMEPSPVTIERLTRSLGKSREELFLMAADGKVSAQSLYDSFFIASEDINRKFGSTKMTITDAMQRIRTRWQFFLSDVDSTSGATDSIGRTMVNVFEKIMNKIDDVVVKIRDFSDSVGGAENAIKILGITAGLVFALFNINKITTGLNAFFKGGGLKTAGTILAITTIVLLVEDFIAFLQGKDSVFGEFLGSIGVDADAVRETILGVAESVKGAFEDVKKWIDDHSELLKNLAIVVGSFAAAWALVTGAVALWNGIAAIATAVTTGFGAAVAFLTSPITLVVLAIGALIAIVLLCIKYWDEIKATAISVWESVKEAWANAAAWFDEKVWTPFKNALKSVGNFFVGIWNGIVGAFEGAINWVIDGINGLLSGVNKLLGGASDLLGKVGIKVEMEIPTIPHVSFGRVPELAEGAVIPPNKKFMAMLGDQGAGNNLEAPESLIRKIVREETGNAASNKTFSVSVQIDSSLQTAVDKIKTALSGALSSVKVTFAGVADVLKDNSYLDVFITSLRETLNANRDKMQAALRAAVSEISVVATANIVKTDTISGLTGGITNNRSINQSNTFNNTFNGPEDVQKKAYKALGKAKEDFTGELARCLAYAR
jgi:tape measure domain-containing protein